MKKLFPLFLLLCVTLSFCKKSDNVTVVSPPAPVDTVALPAPPATFSPHIDTFSGVLNTSISDNYTTDSMRTSAMYVNHITIDSVAVSGNIIIVQDYNDGTGVTEFNTGTIYFAFAADSSGIYKSTPFRHVFNNVTLQGDSLYISMTSMPGSCMILEQQTFAGKKM